MVDNKIENWVCPFCDKGTLIFYMKVTYYEYASENAIHENVYKCNKCGKEL